MFSVLAKPIGPVCNLSCEYCFYTDKDQLYPDQTNFGMSYETLELFIEQYIASQPGSLVTFMWQGGEPTLLGIEFFVLAVKLQEKYLPAGWQVQNVIQTNGTLLDQAWCDFFTANSFLVGLSLDGPAELHDIYRKDKHGQGSFEQVMRGLKLLQNNQVEYNILCSINAVNAKYPQRIYCFLREHDVRFVQFIPIVEFLGDGEVSERSVSGPVFGSFLTHVFNSWIADGLGEISIQLFEECFAVWSGSGARLCTFNQVCGQALVVEHNGDVYACDHFVNPDHYLGNIHQENLETLASSSAIVRFGMQKKTEVGQECGTCPVWFMCHGECPKNRVHGTNHLCAGYRQFFSYISPYMDHLVGSIASRKPIKRIGQELGKIYDKQWNNIGRNDLCPCGSELKYKKCCGSGK